MLPRGYLKCFIPAIRPAAVMLFLVDKSQWWQMASQKYRSSFILLDKYIKETIFQMIQQIQLHQNSSHKVSKEII